MVEFLRGGNVHWIFWKISQIPVSHVPVIPHTVCTVHTYVQYLPSFDDGHVQKAA
jgi:hypothetical protein